MPEATHRGALDPRRAGQAITDLIDLPVNRAPHRPLLPRCWELRNNLTVYDAAYVALAEALETSVLTSDARMSRASGLKCSIELVSTQS